MLVSFSVSNFRSFDEEQTFSLVASGRHAGSHDHHALAIPHSTEKVLRAGIIYGANGAGKSNLFKALRLLREMALETRDKEEALPLEPFLLHPTSGTTRLDVQFISSGDLYRYGVKLTEAQVDEEWLVRIVDGKEKIVFERTTSADGTVSVEAGETGQPESIEPEKFAAMVKVGGPKNQTFLATVLSTLDTWPEWILAVLIWFSRLRLVSPSDPARRNSSPFINDDDLLNFAGEFLSAAATGIDRLQVTQTALAEEEVTAVLSAPSRQRLASAAFNGKPARAMRQNGDVITAERVGDKLDYRLVQVKTAHRGLDGQVVPFDIEQESDGTKRILDLIPALHRVRQSPLCYFIDEIDRSLHPLLAREFIEFFFRSCQNKEEQLIMTTHESSLLDQDLVRRDEIWFAEKDQQGATKLYSLLDFAPRNDLDLRKNYLQGRFGAIPFLGGMERLLAKQHHSNGADTE